MSSSSSSSSSMPRFAANMSFNPIEPTKPSTSTQSSTFKSSTETKSTILQPTKVLTEIVPEAEFDWNSSGLVNPLDGELNFSLICFFFCCCYLLEFLFIFKFFLIAFVQKNFKLSMESKAMTKLTRSSLVTPPKAILKSSLSNFSLIS